MTSILFSAKDNTATNRGTEVYGTDGTAVNTVIFGDLAPGATSSNPNLFKTDGSLTYFRATVGANTSFYSSNGTAAGTVLLDPLNAGARTYTANGYVTFGGSIIFAATDTSPANTGTELYISDGTAAGTHLIKDINPGPSNANPAQPVVNGSRLFFTATDAAHGQEVWVTDGTAANTLRLDAAPDASPASYTNPNTLTNLTSSLELFVATDPNLGSELYVTDGTAAGTKLLADINAGPGNSNPSVFEVANGKAFFQAQDTAGNFGEYVTDGVTVTRLDPETGGVDTVINPANQTLLNGGVLFTASDAAAVSGNELYFSDGTAAGTKLLKDIQPGPTSSTPGQFTLNGSHVYFTADDGVHGPEVYVTDGTTAGTIRLDSGINGANPQYTVPGTIVNLSATKELFVATDTTLGTELFVTDGTAAGTTRLADINAGAGSSNPSNFEVSGGKAFFQATDAAANIQEYVTDGTTVTKLDSVAGGESYTNTGNVALLGNGKAIFTATDLSVNAGVELYVTDGTAAGTKLVDLNAGAGNSNPGGFEIANGKAYFTATDAAGNTREYVSDGTVAGTLALDPQGGTTPSYVTPGVVSGAPLVTFDATSLAADTGSSTSDNVTNNGTVTLSGTVLTRTGTDVIVNNGQSLNMSVHVFDGTKDLGLADVSGDRWSLKATLAEGANVLTATAIDNQSNRAVATGTSTVTVDITPPTVAFTSETPSGGTAGAYTLQGTVENVAGTTVRILDGATDIGAATVTNGTFTFAATLSQGAHNLSAVATDLAGNTATATAAVTVGGLVQTGGPGDDFFFVHGDGAPDQIDGGGGVNYIGLSQAAGTGQVLVNLKDGYVGKGNQIDAFIHNIIGVNLGSDPSTVLGLASGVDLIYNGTGADTFQGQGATDYIQGGSGTNTIIGGSGNEIFFGNGGTDIMRGGSAANFMAGGTTSTSSSTFYGTTGADYVYGHGGSVTLVGGTGSEFLAGGSGFNQLVGTQAGTAQTVGLSALVGSDGTDVFYGGVGTNLMYEGSGTDVFSSTSGTDLIYGGAGKSFVYGGSGTTVVTTGAGNQFVQAGTGQTVFNDTAANQTAGRFDQIDNFTGGKATDVYMAAAAQGSTSFVAQNGGTAILTAVAGGTATLFASNTDVATVQAHTHFTL